MKKELLNDFVKLGLAAAVISAAFPGMGFAEELADSVSTVKDGISNMPVVLSGLAYLAGGATMLHGAGLLKKHADQPTGTSLAQGLSRLGIGGVIAALPVALQFVSNTLSQGKEHMNFEKMDIIR
jgi:hypothetical protein